MAVNKTNVEFLTYTWKEVLYDTGAGSELDKFETEDEEIAQHVQKALFEGSTNMAGIL